MRFKKVAHNYLKYIGLTITNAVAWFATVLTGYMIGKQTGWVVVITFILFLVSLVSLGGVMYVTALIVEEK